MCVKGNVIGKGGWVRVKARFEWAQGLLGKKRGRKDGSLKDGGES